jgi:hypothetical protein
MSYVILLDRLRKKYPDASEDELWDGVALDCYIRSGHVPRDVELARAAARARALLLKYRVDQPRVPAGVREGGQWTRDLGLVGTPDNPNPQGPKLIGQKPVEERPTILLAGGGDSDMNWIARKMNIDRREFGRAVHKLKSENKLGGPIIYLLILKLEMPFLKGFISVTLRIT